MTENGEKSSSFNVSGEQRNRLQFHSIQEFITCTLITSWARTADTTLESTSQEGRPYGQWKATESVVILVRYNQKFASTYSSSNWKHIISRKRNNHAEKAWRSWIEETTTKKSKNLETWFVTWAKWAKRSKFIGDQARERCKYIVEAGISEQMVEGSMENFQTSLNNFFFLFLSKFGNQHTLASVQRTQILAFSSRRAREMLGKLSEREWVYATMLNQTYESHCECSKLNQFISLIMWQNGMYVARSHSVIFAKKLLLFLATNMRELFK